MWQTFFRVFLPFAYKEKSNQLCIMEIELVITIINVEDRVTQDVTVRWETGTFVAMRPEKLS